MNAFKMHFQKILMSLGTLQPDRSMTTRMRRVLLFTVAILALIVTVNAVILKLVSRNRAGEPEAELVLSEREFSTQNGLFREDTGRFVRLEWHNANFPSTLLHDAAKLAALGVKEHGMRRHSRERKVFVVLELDGPRRASYLAEQEVELANARVKAQNIAKTVQELPASPGGRQEQTQDELDKQRSDAERRVRDAEAYLRRLQEEDSRLFLADVDLDAALLRTRYPNRKQCLILPARLSSWYDYEGEIKAIYLALEQNLLFVPRSFASAFRKVGRRRGEDRKGPPARLRLAVGKRYEPWVRSLETGE